MSALIIVEEDADRLARLEKMARALDFDVLTASTGAEGASLIKRQASSLAFVSASMPDFSGYELASRLAYDYSVAVVLMVDKNEDVGQSMSLSKGVIEFIYRPVCEVEFAARVHRAPELSSMLRVRERLVFELNRLSQTDGQTLSILLGHMKSEQYTFRYGGEEFTILLPNTEEDAAMRLTNLLRLEIESMGEMKYQKSPVTASIGVAQFSAEETPEAFVARVDAAMYEAKSSGRNRVIAADTDVPAE